jgi:hypothetical protein
MPNDTCAGTPQIPYTSVRKGSTVKRPVRLPHSEGPGMLLDMPNAAYPTEVRMAA